MATFGRTPRSILDKGRSLIFVHGFGKPLTKPATTDSTSSPSVIPEAQRAKQRAELKRLLERKGGSDRTLRLPGNKPKP